MAEAAGGEGFGEDGEVIAGLADCGFGWCGGGIGERRCDGVGSGMERG